MENPLNLFLDQNEHLLHLKYTVIKSVGSGEECDSESTFRGRAGLDCISMLMSWHAFYLENRLK